MRKIDFEEKIFRTVADEVRQGRLSEGLWLKANVDAGGDEYQARLLYTKYRASQLAGEVADSVSLHQQGKKIARYFKKLCWEYLPYTVMALFLLILLLSGAVSNTR